MKLELLKEFDDDLKKYLISEELGIRIRHVAYGNLTISYEPGDRGKLYTLESDFYSDNVITWYMTKKMILKAFKNIDFEIREWQCGGA